MIKLNLLDISAIRQLSKEKELVIWGSRERAETLRGMLITAGIKSISIMHVENNMNESDEVTDTIDLEMVCKDIESYYILVISKKSDNLYKYVLEEKGFVHIRDYCYIENVRTQTKMGNKSDLDITMGHGKWTDGLEACRFIGDFANADVRIAINGASLADECSFDWKIWPQLLYDCLIKKGLSVAIAMHSNYGYTTSQCFLKFVRDIVPQQPDLVIDYLPWENDCYYGKTMKTPYIVGYQKKAFVMLKGRLSGRYDDNLVDKIQLGRQVGQYTGDVITTNVILTKRVCDEIGSDYLCILPPSILTKNRNSVYEEERYFSLKESAMVTNDICDFAYNKLAEAIGDSLIDAREWMNEFRDVFYDQFHMYESGNSVIADKLMELIYERYRREI